MRGRLLLLLLLVLRRGHPRVRLTLIGPVHAMGIVTHLLRARVAPVPVLTPAQRHVGSGGALVGAFDAPVELVLPVALEVVLRLGRHHPGRRGLLLVHPVAGGGGGAHGRAILWVRPPQVVVAHAAALVVVAHVWVRGRRRVGTGKAGAEYSSGAIHIHFAIHICRSRGEKSVSAQETDSRFRTEALHSDSIQEKILTLPLLRKTHGGPVSIK